MNDFYMAVARLGMSRSITLASVYEVWFKFSLDTAWLQSLPRDEYLQFFMWFEAFQSRVGLGVAS